MKPRGQRLYLLVGAVLLGSLSLVGCIGSQTDHEIDFKLGDLVAPFDPPSLEQLDAEATWIDGPVKDSMELLRQRLVQEPPLVTVQEALAMRNDSPEDNLKIRSAMGRLPESDGEVAWSSTITRHSFADVKANNPILLSSVVEFDINGLTGFGLMGFDWNFEPFAAKDTVVSWQSSKDGLYDKIVMRDDLVWSDGTPITAHDIEFSFKLIMTDQVPVPAVRTGTDRLKYVKAYDDHTVVFFHKEPLAINVWNISFPILPKHIFEHSVAEDPTLTDSDYHVKLENHPVTGGPYEFASRQPGHEVALKRRESWYMHDGKQVREKPFFETVRFRIILDPSPALLALKAAGIDEMMLNPEQWTTQTSGDDFYRNNTKVYDTEWVYYYFCWNTEVPYFADKRVRQAMSLAFDHQELLEKLRFNLNEPSLGIFHPKSRWAPENPSSRFNRRDLTEAERLLDEAGWKDHDGDGFRDKDGRKFEFNILTMNKPDRVAICTLLKENLSQLGIACNVSPLEFTVLQDKTQKRDFQAFMGGWGTGAYPDSNLNIWGTGQDRNYANYSNVEVDELFKQAERELDDSRRREIFARIHQILYDDQPYTWLFVNNAFYGFNKDLRGYVFSPRGPYNYGPGFSAIWKPAH